MATLLSPISTLYQPARARSRYFPISRIFFKLPRLMALHPSRSPTGIFSTRTQPYTPGYSACTPFSPLTLVAWYHLVPWYWTGGYHGTYGTTMVPWYQVQAAAASCAYRSGVNWGRYLRVRAQCASFCWQRRPPRRWSSRATPSKQRCSAPARIASSSSWRPGEGTASR